MAALEALAGFANLQEVILQNFVPHRRYYGEEPAEIATEAAERYWRTGLHDGPGRARAGVVVAGDRRGHGAAGARGAAADARRRRSRSRRTSRTGGRGSSRRARPTSAG